MRIWENIMELSQRVVRRRRGTVAALYLTSDDCAEWARCAGWAPELLHSLASGDIVLLSIREQKIHYRVRTSIPNIILITSSIFCYGYVSRISYTRMLLYKLTLHVYLIFIVLYSYITFIFVLLCYRIVSTCIFRLEITIRLVLREGQTRWDFL